MIQSSQTDSVRFSLAPPLLLRRESFGGLAFDRRSWHIMELNRTAHALLEFLRKKPSTDAAIFEWIEESHDPLSVKEKDEIREFLRGMVLRQVLYSPTRPDGRTCTFSSPCYASDIGTSSEEPPRNEDFPRRLCAPISIWWDITSTCNLACKHCYSASGKRLPDELTTSEVCRVLRELAAMRLFYVYFLGGEPLLRPDFPGILDVCRQLGISVMLNTNGWFVTKQMAQKLASLGVHHVRVSLDGATPATHDGIRGIAGSFERAVSAVRELLAAGIPQVGITPTIMADNFHEAEAIIDLAHQLKVHEIQLGQLCPVGRGQDLQTLGVDHVLALRQLLPRKIDQYKHSILISGTEGIWHGKPNYKSVMNGQLIPTLMGCGGGRSVLAIGSTGKVRACLLFQHEIADLRTATFDQIWHDTANPRMNWLRLGRPGCGGCTYSEICSGPCPMEPSVTRADRRRFVSKLRNVTEVQCQNS